MRYRQKSPPQLRLLSRSLAAPIADDLERLKDELLALLGLELRLHFRGERLLHEPGKGGAQGSCKTVFAGKYCRGGVLGSCRTVLIGKTLESKWLWMQDDDPDDDDDDGDGDEDGGDDDDYCDDDADGNDDGAGDDDGGDDLCYTS